MMLHSKTEKESKKRHGPVMCACQLVVRKQYQPKTLDICGVAITTLSNEPVPTNN
jgi:ribosomal protein L28